MAEEETEDDLPAVRMEYRETHRYPVHNEAVLSLIGQNLSLHCRVLDLSLGGCRLRAKNQFKTRPKVPVEVTFKIRGLPMLLRGIIQWTDGEDLFGIRFVDLSSRRKDALVDLLYEIAAFRASEAKRKDGTRAALCPTEDQAPEQPSAPPVSEQFAPRQQPAELRLAGQPTPIAGAREPRAQSPQEEESEEMRESGKPVRPADSDEKPLQD